MYGHLFLNKKNVYEKMSLKKLKNHKKMQFLNIITRAKFFLEF